MHVPAEPVGLDLDPIGHGSHEQLGGDEGQQFLMHEHVGDRGMDGLLGTRNKLRYMSCCGRNSQETKTKVLYKRRPDLRGFLN
jgi:hypothetical protein